MSQHSTTNNESSSSHLDTTPSKLKAINTVPLSLSFSPSPPIMRQQLNKRNKQLASDWKKRKDNRTAIRFLSLVFCLSIMTFCSFNYIIIPNSYYDLGENGLQLSHNAPLNEDVKSSGGSIVARRIKDLEELRGIRTHKSNGDTSTGNLDDNKDIKSKNSSGHTINLNQIINQIHTANATIEAPDLAACILIKDENHNLDEWIAYHYLTLPLRYLVVTVDPTSETSPEPILSKWNKADLGLTIVTWNDTRFMPVELQGDLPPTATFNETRDRHRERQNRFYGQCLRYLRNRKWTWTLLIDVDEFLVYNHAGYGEKYYVKAWNDTSKDYQYELRFPFPKNRNMSLMEEKVYSTMLARTNLPTEIGTPTFSEFINTHSRGVNRMPWLNRRCLTMARLTFGNMEESNQTKLYENIPPPFDPMKFNTLRYFHHATKGKLKENKYGKTMIDVSRIAHSSVTQKTRQVHTPVVECGSIRSANPPYNISLFRVNHYASSPEAFFAKQDIRRTAENYEWRSSVNNGTIYDMQPWLKLFVDRVGLDKALFLLKDAGNLDELLRIRNRTQFVNQTKTE